MKIHGQLLILKRNKIWMAMISRNCSNAAINHLFHNFVVIFDRLKQGRIRAVLTICCCQTLNFFGCFMKSTNSGFMIEMWFIWTRKHRIQLILITGKLKWMNCIEFLRDSICNNHIQLKSDVNAKFSEQSEISVRGFWLSGLALQWFHSHRKPTNAKSIEIAQSGMDRPFLPTPYHPIRITRRRNNLWGFRNSAASAESIPKLLISFSLIFLMKTKAETRFPVRRS